MYERTGVAALLDGLSLEGWFCCVSDWDWIMDRGLYTVWGLFFSEMVVLHDVM